VARLGRTVEAVRIRRSRERIRSTCDRRQRTGHAKSQGDA
jgi:hypothetical protein